LVQGLDTEETVDKDGVASRIKKLRLGDRLKVEWDILEVPHDAYVPPLLIQPLLENAIYHGIEPRHAGGCITIHGEFDSQTINIRIGNPVPVNKETVHQNGNRIAMDNIRQRLLAFYDKPGALSTAVTAERFEVSLAFPYREHSQ